MFNRKRIVVFSAIATLGLVSLVGCSDSQQATTSGAPVATVKTTTAGLDRLQSIVSDTQTAVEANNLTQAQDTFNGFEDVWKQVEDSVKRQNANTYDAIESNMDKVRGEFKAAPPKQAVISSALQALQTELASITN